MYLTSELAMSPPSFECSSHVDPPDLAHSCLPREGKHLLAMSGVSGSQDYKKPFAFPVLLSAIADTTTRVLWQHVAVRILKFAGRSPFNLCEVEMLYLS